jgi:hypothetical protein
LGRIVFANPNNYEEKIVESFVVAEGLVLKWNRRADFMNIDSLLGVWTGTAHNNNGWDMKITLSVLQPVEVGSMLGVFDIPLIPCSGTFRVKNIRGEIIDLRAEKLKGDCGEAVSESLELLSDGTLLYISKGDGWETRGVLQRMN